MATSNPALRDSVFDDVGASATHMTLQGTVLRTLFLLALIGLTGAWTWSRTLDYSVAGEAAGGAFGAEMRVSVAPAVYQYLTLGSLGGLVLAMITIFAPRMAPYTSPFYALCEGLALGGLSAIFDTAYPGVALQAVSITFAIAVAMQVIYGTGLIRVTQKFAAGVMAATLGVCLVYLVDLVAGFWGARVPFLHETGLVGIGISALVCIIAAMNLLLDFEFINQGVQRHAPRFMEWYAAFGVCVTLVWLYIEVLRLLAKLRSRD